MNCENHNRLDCPKIPLPMWKRIRTSEVLYLTYMPVRTTPFVNQHFYHIYNRGVEKRPIFLDKRDYQRMKTTISYYRYTSLPMKLSDFLKLSFEEKGKVVTHHQHPALLTVDLICFSFMPNHYHLLIQQKSDRGISKFMKNISDSYTRYFNTRHERVGPLFQGQFKAVLIDSDEQLLHLSRYIHLNPLTSFVVKDFSGLINYQWSSLHQYIFADKGICKSDFVLNAFPSRKAYRKFVSDQAEYQQKLEVIKHITFE